MKFKKILSFLIVVSMILSTLGTVTFANAEEATISVSADTATRGETVDITVSAVNNPGITCAKLKINYDSTGLELTKVEDSGVWSGAMHNTADYTANPYTLSWQNSLATSNITANGTLVTMTFKVKENAPFKDYPINVTYNYDNDEIMDKNDNPIQFTLVNGKITVENKSKITVSSEKCKIGSTVDVKVSAVENPGITCAKLKIGYDSTALKLTKVVDSGVWSGAMHNTADYTANPYTLSWQNSLATSNITANGTLVTLTFEVLNADGVEVGDVFPINISYNYDNDEIMDKNDNPIEFGLVNGSITVIDEVVVGPTWPDAATVVAPITYGQKVSEAFTLGNGKVTIDDVEYDGVFSVSDVDKDRIPDAGTTEAKVIFTVTEEGDHKDRVFDAPAYYNVTVNKAEYAGTITAAPDIADYTGIAIDYNGTLTYNEAEVEPGTITYSADPINVGTYDVTIPFTSLNANYADPADVKTTLEIKKVRATEITDDAIVWNFNAGDYADAAALETAIALPGEVNVTFGNDLAGTVVADWSAADKEWKVKGDETYKYTATLSSDNIDVSTLPAYIATVNVAPVNATIEGAAVSKAISKNEAENATAETLGLPEEVNLVYADTAAASGIALTPVWEENIIEAVKSAAADVTSDDVVIKEDVKLDVEATLGDDYKHVTVTNTNALVVSISISNKKLATVTGTFTVEDIVYGETVSENIDLTWEYADDSASGGNADFVITYKDAQNNESTEKPTATGTYTAIATLTHNDYYAETIEDTFTIAKKPITLNVADASKTYGGENPTFALTEATPEDLGLTFDCVATTTTNAGTYDITVTATNPNYEYTYNKGTLTINKAAVTGAPVISGDAVVGGTLAATFANEQVTTFQWYVGGEAVVDATSAYYVPVIADSNKAITVKAVAGEDNTNYTGESDSSAAVTVDKYEMTGVVNTTINTETLAVGSVVTADVSGIYGYDVMGLTYAWAIGGVTVDGATAHELTIPADATGVVTVTVTPSADYTGSIIATVGEIDKKKLAGSIVLSLADEALEPVVGSSIAASVDVAGDYDIVWLVDDVASAVTGDVYAITAADLGKEITAKVIGKGEYTGEILSLDTYYVEPLVPSNVVITTEVTKNSITVTVTADANGTEIEYLIALDDAEPVSAEIVDGVGTYTFEGLSSKTTYTIKVVAMNEAYETEATATATTKAAGGTASPVTGGATGTTTKPTTPPADETPSTGETETPSTTVVPDVVVESKTETATVPAADLKDASVVAATVTTESGAKVDVTVDVADKAVDSLTVSADKANAEVTGKAADGIVGDAIEVKVDAKSGDTAVAVEATIAIDVEEQAYAYAVDELGNTVRLESAYDAETGKLLVAGVADGTVVAVSTTAPVDFADTADRWSHKEVARAADLGIVSGRAADAYAPAELLTRSETNKLKKNLAEVLKLELTVNADVKIDTDPSHWAYEADLWAAQTGITNGTGKTEDGTVVISGGDNVVRQDYLTLLARMIKLAIGDVTIEGTGVEFADAEHVADYAADSIKLLSSIGILKGSEGADGVYANPKANITREEAAALSNRAYEFVKVLKTAK